MEAELNLFKLENDLMLIRSIIYDRDNSCVHVCLFKLNLSILQRVIYITSCNLYKKQPAVFIDPVLIARGNS